MSKQIILAPGFQKFYQKSKKRHPNFVKHFKDAVEDFLKNPKLVRDHKLNKKDLSGYRAFSVTIDIRVVYKETKNSYIFLRVGSHREVY